MELARDAVLLSRTPEIPFAMVLKCRAQAASMFRQANSASRELRSLKEARAKALSLLELSGAAERAEHLATVLMAEGLTNPPPPVKLMEPDPDDSAPLIVALHETESLSTETETPARRPLPATASPAQPAEAAHADRTPPSVSSHDLQTRKHKNETAARHEQNHELPPDHPDANLVGAWRLAHLFPVRDDD